MIGISRKIRLAGCALILVGCRNVQYPSLAPSQINAERQSFAYHDPTPDTDAGPWVERPRGFERPRAVPRRVLEKEEITEELIRNNGGAANSNPSASRYPNSVNP